MRFPRAHAGLFGLLGLDGQTHLHEGRRAWRRGYWLFAAALPFLLFVFEAVKIASYSTMRAPNVGVAVQILMMLGFYASWVIVPRFVYVVAAQDLDATEGLRQRRVWLRLLALGLGFCILHLLLLAYLLRLQFSPPGWTVSDLIVSFGEVWLRDAGLWLIIYAAAVTAIVASILKQARNKAPARLEIRQNGKLQLLPIDAVYWIKAAGNYVELHTERGVFMQRKTLAEMDRALANSTFLRSHRSALVNAAHVASVKPHPESSGFILVLANGMEAPLSRRMLSRVRAHLKAAA